MGNDDDAGSWVDDDDRQAFDERTWRGANATTLHGARHDNKATVRDKDNTKRLRLVILVFPILLPHHSYRDEEDIATVSDRNPLLKENCEPSDPLLRRSRNSC